MRQGIRSACILYIILSVLHGTRPTKVQIETKTFGDEKKVVIHTIPSQKANRQNRNTKGRKLNDDSESADIDEDEPSVELEDGVEKVDGESEQGPVEVHRPNFEETGRRFEGVPE